MTFRLYDRCTNKIITEKVVWGRGIFLTPFGDLVQIVTKKGALHLIDVTKRYGLLRKVPCG